MNPKDEVLITLHHSIDTMKRVIDGNWGHKMLSKCVSNLEELVKDKDSALHRIEHNKELLEKIDDLKEEIEELKIKMMVHASKV